MKFKNIVIFMSVVMLSLILLTGCTTQLTGSTTQKYVDAAKTILDENDLDGVVSMVFDSNYEGYQVYDLVVTSEKYSNLSDSQKKQILEKLNSIWVEGGKLLVMPEVVSQGYTYSLDYNGNLERDGEIYPPLPTSKPFVMPTGDFSISWDTYNSEYNSILGGILTIRRQGSTYTQTLVYSDGSCSTTDLTVISEGEEIKLTDRPGNPFGDHMIITSNGYLHFYDNQGEIYSVPPLNSGQVPITDTECVQPQAEPGKEINVVMSVSSVESIGGDKVKITIATNLPDEMLLMMDLKDSGSYWAQSEGTVKGGKLVTTFGNVGTGNYRLTISSPVVEIQPENVKAVLGENGKNMVGDLVTFDPHLNSYFIEYTSNIVVK